MKSYYVYVMGSISGILYIGVTNDLERRGSEHKTAVKASFTKRYNCFKLVYFEETNSIYEAISREKEVKKWSRLKKEKLIKHMNPLFSDLSLSWK